jgi:uncharacterized damage-inducible protein DinB
MDTRLAPFADILRLNTRLFLNCLDEVDDASGSMRVNSATNSLTFVAVHTLDARAYLTKALGGDGVHPFTEMLSAVTSIEEVGELPTLDQIRAAWADVTVPLLDRVAAVSSAELEAEAPAAFPIISDPTLLGMVAFLVQHDSYHIGQMAFLRKALGFDAMSYSEREDA